MPAPVHFSNVGSDSVVCSAATYTARTTLPALVGCPECLDWLVRHASTHGRELADTLARFEFDGRTWRRGRDVLDIDSGMFRLRRNAHELGRAPSIRSLLSMLEALYTVRANGAGLSLVELLVTVGALLVLALASLPMLGDLSRLRADGETSQLVQELRLCRQSTLGDPVPIAAALGPAGFICRAELKWTPPDGWTVPAASWSFTGTGTTEPPVSLLIVAPSTSYALSITRPGRVVVEAAP
jgi:hypothetical protein